MAFSFYHSLITVPTELSEATAVLRLSAWQRFWKLEVPFAMPALVWNTMMSVSGGWFFVVASEVIVVVGRENPQALPGIGGYISRAIAEADVPAMAYAGIALLLLVLLYDQLIFRPIVAWAEKFKFEQSEAQETPQSWMLTLVQRSRFAHRLATLPAPLIERLSLATSRRERPTRPIRPARSRRWNRALDWVWTGMIVVTTVALLLVLGRFMFGADLGFADGQALASNPNVNVRPDPATAAAFQQAGVEVSDDQTVYLSNLCAAAANGAAIPPALTAALARDGVRAPTKLRDACNATFVPPGKVAWRDAAEVVKLGLLTTLRVVLLIVLATLFWTPIGVWIGLRPRVAQRVQPFAQFAAAFPANLLFPIAVVLIAHYALNPNVWLSPLMVLGTQWYILFNVIAGTTAIPNDLKEAARVARLRGWTWWRTLIIPGIFPAFVTGGITASGGSWNASIVAETASWGATTLVATGLGAYIASWSTGAFNPHVALGMLAMGLFVLCFNRLVWRRLYDLAETRFRLD
jgi:NitT/TauT family transport system permease protein